MYSEYIVDPQVKALEEAYGPGFLGLLGNYNRLPSNYSGLLNPYFLERRELFP